MSAHEQNKSVSQAVQELNAKVETWEATLAALLGAVGMTVYFSVGPVKEMKQEIVALGKEMAKYKRVWWDKATEAQRAQILSQDAAPQK